MIGNYTCLNCGKTFDEPDEYFEKHGLDSPPYERFSCCPYCGCEGYIETIICDHCGEPITGEYIELPDGKCYCDNCYSQHDAGGW